MTHQLGAQASQDYLGEVRTKLLLWRGRPVEAWECARAVLDRWASAASHVHAGTMPALAARAASDAAVAGGRSDTMTELTSLMDALEGLIQVSDDPLGAAVAATYDAEVARGLGHQTTAMWLDAGARFDRLRRPHPAAYCRWRGAQVALSTGRGTVASGLIDTALRDARQHLPLTTAILTTRQRGGAGGRLGVKGLGTLMR